MLHVPLMLELTTHMPSDPVLAIAIATSISSAIKTMTLVLVSQSHEDVRNSRVPFFRWKTFTGSEDDPSDIYNIGLPSLIMFCTEGWAF